MLVMFKSKCHSTDSFVLPVSLLSLPSAIFLMLSSCTDVFTLVTTWNAENNIAQCHITVCPFVTYPLFTFLLPCFWLGNRPRKFQSWYTCNYHISSLSLDLINFWLSPFGTYIYIYAFACSQHEFFKLSMQSENMFTSLEKKCLYLFICMTCMPKIKYIRYRVVHVYTLSNHDNYNISILDYENLAFHFWNLFTYVHEFSFFYRYDISGKVDISDLTWEQKERVIRYLFARMNGGAKVTKMNSGPPLPAIENKVQRLSITHEPRYVFLTPPQQAQTVTYLFQKQVPMATNVDYPPPQKKKIN